MNFFSAIINVNRISDYSPNVTIQNIINYSTKNMSHYMECLNNRVYATTSQILNVVCEGGSWSNLTSRDVQILNILQNHVERVVNTFNSTIGYVFEYCTDIEIIPTINLTHSICKLPSSYNSTNFVNPIQFCLQGIKYPLKFCGDIFCDSNGLAHKNCVTDCFSTENTTLFDLEELSPNGDQSKFFYTIMESVTSKNWENEGVISKLNPFIRPFWWIDYGYSSHTHGDPSYPILPQENGGVDWPQVIGLSMASLLGCCLITAAGCVIVGMVKNARTTSLPVNTMPLLHEMETLSIAEKGSLGDAEELPD